VRIEDNTRWGSITWRWVSQEVTIHEKWLPLLVRRGSHFSYADYLFVVFIASRQADYLNDGYQEITDFADLG